ncbi:DNA replication/repair protein RecF [Gordonia sp. TBRC 11910]|uniref:DNA replication and repair protein RecF n=1 Tax=Gordonia asplenii TaxID=2725283 RepID=A0A848L0J9_9ACTN|nr:DNA replication/repair protein RecF [Gordonia asplenii]NMO02595.1 DNA replication/repair protein RecF [Gordonia asplenii]
MFVRELTLRDFRSWPQVSLSLRPEATIFVGRNGFGKTNLVESLFYLTNLRSHRVSSDAVLVRTGAADAQLTATVEHAGRELTVDLTVRSEGSNKAAINGRPVRRTREVVGILRSVLFAPEDLALVRGEPADRRRFLDEIVANRGPGAIADKADYDRVLRQRSALLKSAAAAMRRGGSEAASIISTLDVWDAQLAGFGARVTAARIDDVAKLNPLFTQAYSAIAPHSRPASLTYRCSLGPEVINPDGSAVDTAAIEALMIEKLAAVRGKEIDRGQSLLGPHRDDLDIVLGSDVAKGFASHGESWSLALSLRLGTVELLRTEGIEPVIMLDDVFAELDAARRTHLATFVESAEQLLITAAVAEDLPDGIGGRIIGVDIEDNEGERRSQIREVSHER